MRTFFSEFVIAAAVLLTTAARAEVPCTLHKLSVNPIAPGKNDIFAGVGRTLRVEFQSDSRRDDVRVFPEPPMIVRHLKSNRSCAIQGGIWARDSVFLSEDERLLVVLEFSGESNHLISYQTSTCRKVADLDVSGGRWLVTESGVVVGSQCATRALESCQEKHAVSMKRLCSPAGEAHER